MTKNKFRNLITVVAVILVFVLAGGWIAQSVINRQNQSGTKSKMGSCFILTPQNEENSIMTLSAEAYSSTDDSANLNSAAAFYQGESYTLTATVRSFTVILMLIGKLSLLIYLPNMQPEITLQITFR